MNKENIHIQIQEQNNLQKEQSAFNSTTVKQQNRVPITRFKQYSPDARDGIAKKSIADELTKEAIRAFNNHQRFKLLENLKARKQQDKLFFQYFQTTGLESSSNKSSAKHLTPQKQITTQTRQTKFEIFEDDLIQPNNQKLSPESHNNYYFSGIRKSEEKLKHGQQAGLVIKDNYYSKNPIGLSTVVNFRNNKLDSLQEEPSQEEQINMKIKDKKLVSKQSSMNFVIISTSKKQQIDNIKSEVQKNEQFLPILSTNPQSEIGFQLEDLLLTNTKFQQNQKQSFKFPITSRISKELSNSFGKTQSQIPEQVEVIHRQNQNLSQVQILGIDSNSYNNRKQKIKIYNHLDKKIQSKIPEELQTSAIKILQRTLTKKVRQSKQKKHPLVSIKDTSQNTSDDLTVINANNQTLKSEYASDDLRVKSITNSVNTSVKQLKTKKKKVFKNPKLSNEFLILKLQTNDNDEKQGENIIKVDMQKASGTVPEEEEGESEYAHDFELNQSSTHSVSSDHKENKSLYPQIHDLVIQDKKIPNKVSISQKIVRIERQQKLPVVASSLKMVSYNSRLRNTQNQINHASPFPQFIVIGKSRADRYMLQTLSGSSSPNVTYSAFNSNIFNFQQTHEPQWDYRTDVAKFSQTQTFKHKKSESAFFQKNEPTESDLPQLFLPFISKNKQDLHKSVQSVVKQIFQSKDQVIKQDLQKNDKKIVKQNFLYKDGHPDEFSSIYNNFNQINGQLPQKSLQKGKRIINTQTDRTAVLRQLKMPDGQIKNFNMKSDGSSLKNFGDILQQNELGRKYSDHDRGFSNLTEKQMEQGGLLSYINERDASHDVVNTLEIKNQSLISLRPPSLSALMQNSNSRTSPQNNLAGKNTYPMMQMNSASESSLHLNNTNPSVIDDLMQTISEFNQPEKNDKQETQSKFFQQQYDNVKDKKHIIVPTLVRSPIAARKLYPSSSVLKEREKQKQDAKLNKQIALERMNDILHKTISKKFEQIIKNQYILVKDKTKKSLGSSANSPVHSSRLIQLNKSSQDVLFPNLEFSPKMQITQNQSQILSKVQFQTLSNFKLFDPSVIPKECFHQRVLQQSPVPKKKKQEQKQILTEVIQEYETKESKQTTPLKVSRDDLTDPSHRSISPGKSSNRIGFTTLLLRGSPSALFGINEKTKSQVLED